MNEKDGWIKLYSKFKNWKWYHNQNTKDLFIHCLLSANWKDSKFEDIEIKRGSFITSYKNLSSELNLTIQNLRTALNHLKSTGELTVTKHQKFIVITVNNYNEHQRTNTITNSQLTRYQQAINTILTTIEEYKNIDIIKERIYSACACAREEEKKDTQIFDYDWMDDNENQN